MERQQSGSRVSQDEGNPSSSSRPMSSKPIISIKVNKPISKAIKIREPSSISLKQTESGLLRSASSFFELEDVKPQGSSLPLSSAPSSSQAPKADVQIASKPVPDLAAIHKSNEAIIVLEVDEKIVSSVNFEAPPPPLLKVKVEDPKPPVVEAAQAHTQAVQEREKPGQAFESRGRSQSREREKERERDKRNRSVSSSGSDSSDSSDRRDGGTSR